MSLFTWRIGRDRFVFELFFVNFYSFILRKILPCCHFGGPQTCFISPKKREVWKRKRLEARSWARQSRLSAHLGNQFDWVVFWWKGAPPRGCARDSPGFKHSSYFSSRLDLLHLRHFLTSQFSCHFWSDTKLTGTDRRVKNSFSTETAKKQRETIAEEPLESHNRVSCN